MKAVTTEEICWKKCRHVEGRGKNKQMKAVTPEEMYGKKVQVC